MFNFLKSKTPQKTPADHAEDALYREVNEEIRAQQAYDFVRKHARILIAIAATAMIIVISVQLVKRYNAKTLLESAAAYESAVIMMESGNPRAAAEALSRTASRSSGGMADLSLFSAAKIDLQTGDTMGGIAKLEKLAKDGSTRDFRDIATLNLATLKAGDMTPKEFEQFTASLQTKRSPFYYTGLLLVAQKYIAADDTETARIWLDRITSDRDAPIGIAAQAEMLK
ncbi:MAG: tetratricopeptide repeat protein [Alphaproteobacteria bacterium]|nr:tetratricopeptide repeat protein [Alphaproteobacteria bacterium]